MRKSLFYLGYWAVLFTDCECRHMPDESHKFSLKASVKSEIAYLESNDRVEIDFFLEINGNAQEKDNNNYILSNWELSDKAMGNLLDANKARVTPGMPLHPGHCTFFYEPKNTGEHILQLHVTPAAGQGLQSITLKPILVQDKQQLPFTMTLEAPKEALLAHQTAEMTLGLQADLERAREAQYTLKSLTLSHGSLYKHRKALKPGEQVAFGEQQLQWRLDKEETIEQEQEVTVSLTIENHKGDLRQQTSTLLVRPIKFEAELWGKKEVANNRNNKAVKLKLGIRIDADEALRREDDWMLTAWQFPESMQGTVLDAQGDQLSRFRLRGMETNLFSVECYHLPERPGATMQFTITGPGGVAIDRTLSLDCLFEAVIEKKVERLQTIAGEAGEVYKEFKREINSKELTLSPYAQFQEAIKTFPRYRLQQATQQELAEHLRALQEGVREIEVSYNFDRPMGSFTKVLESIDELEKQEKELTSKLEAWQQALQTCLETCSNEGNYFLHKAAQQEDTQVLEIILQYSPNVAIKDSDGYTPLHLAAQAGSISALSRLVAKEASINAVGHNNETPLLLAVRAEHVGATQWLLDHGADATIAERLKSSREVPVIPEKPYRNAKGVVCIVLDQPKLTMDWPPLYEATQKRNKVLIRMLTTR